MYHDDGRDVTPWFSLSSFDHCSTSHYPPSFSNKLCRYVPSMICIKCDNDNDNNDDDTIIIINNNNNDNTQ